MLSSHPIEVNHHTVACYHGDNMWCVARLQWVVQRKWRRYLMPFHIVREPPSSACCTTGSVTRYNKINPNTLIEHIIGSHDQCEYHMLVISNRQADLES